ncbi:MAG: YciI family protein [Woeseiaceae bacterium]
MAEHAPTVDRVPGQSFLVLAFDAEGSAETREQALDGHLEYMEKHCDRYLVAGPLREPGGSSLIGSFFLLIADDEADARQFLSGDPYMQSEMYAEVKIMSATPAAGRWMGGVIWDSAESIRGRAS